MNSSTGLAHGCLCLETDVTLNPSLKGGIMRMIPKKNTYRFFENRFCVTLGSIDSKAEE